jgi:hypothetical protein
MPRRRRSSLCSTVARSSGSDQAAGCSSRCATRRTLKQRGHRISRPGTDVLRDLAQQMLTVIAVELPLDRRPSQEVWEPRAAEPLDGPLRREGRPTDPLAGSERRPQTVWFARTPCSWGGSPQSGWPGDHRLWSSAVMAYTSGSPGRRTTVFSSTAIKARGRSTPCARCRPMARSTQCHEDGATSTPQCRPASSQLSKDGVSISALSTAPGSDEHTA